jgi:hypothetical protein
MIKSFAGGSSRVGLLLDWNMDTELDESSLERKPQRR